MRWVSTSSFFNIYKMRIPSAIPVAPVMDTAVLLDLGVAVSFPNCFPVKLLEEKILFIRVLRKEFTFIHR